MPTFMTGELSTGEHEHKAVSMIQHVSVHIKNIRAESVLLSLCMQSYLIDLPWDRSVLFKTMAAEE